MAGTEQDDKVEITEQSVSEEHIAALLDINTSLTRQVAIERAVAKELRHQISVLKQMLASPEQAPDTETSD